MTYDFDLFTRKRNNNQDQAFKMFTNLMLITCAVFFYTLVTGLQRFSNPWSSSSLSSHLCCLLVSSCFDQGVSPPLPSQALRQKRLYVCDAAEELRKDLSRGQFPQTSRAQAFNARVSDPRNGAHLDLRVPLKRSKLQRLGHDSKSDFRKLTVFWISVNQSRLC